MHTLNKYFTKTILLILLALSFNSHASLISKCKEIFGGKNPVSNQNVFKINADKDYISELNPVAVERLVTQILEDAQIPESDTVILDLEIRTNESVTPKQQMKYTNQVQKIANQFAKKSPKINKIVTEVAIKKVNRDRPDETDLISSEEHKILERYDDVTRQVTNIIQGQLDRINERGEASIKTYKNQGQANINQIDPLDPNAITKKAEIEKEVSQAVQKINDEINQETAKLEKEKTTKIDSIEREKAAALEKARSEVAAKSSRVKGVSRKAGSGVVWLVSLPWRGTKKVGSGIGWLGSKAWQGTKKFGSGIGWLGSQSWKGVTSAGRGFVNRSKAMGSSITAYSFMRKKDKANNEIETQRPAEINENNENSIAEIQDSSVTETAETQSVPSTAEVLNTEQESTDTETSSTETQIMAETAETQSVPSTAEVLNKEQESTDMETSSTETQIMAETAETQSVPSTAEVLNKEQESTDMETSSTETQTMTETAETQDSQTMTETAETQASVTKAILLAVRYSIEEHNKQTQPGDPQILSLNLYDNLKSSDAFMNIFKAYGLEQPPSRAELKQMFQELQERQSKGEELAIEIDLQKGLNHFLFE